MTTPPALYLFDPDGVAPEAMVEELRAVGPVKPLPQPLPGPAGAGVGEEDAGPTPPPGWIFIPEGTSPAKILDLLETLSPGTDEWSPLLVRRGDGPEDATIVPLAAGFAEPMSRTLERLRDGEMEPALLSFRVTLRELARIRHDLNNPLTAALAEIQLLLMDADPDSEDAASMQVVEAQLGRLRDLVKQLTPLRIPRG